jgi:hypothetical protein
MRVNATAEIEQNGGAHEQMATETDARQSARFAAAGILAAAKKLSVRTLLVDEI